MPSIKKIRTKSGLSFKITVSCGYDERYRKRCHFKTWKAPENWSEQRAEREAQKVAYEFDHVKRMAVGLNYMPIPQIIIKAEYAKRFLAEEYNNEPSLSIGIAFVGWFNR